MKNRMKLVVLCGLMAFPMMVAFQNCSRTVAMQMTDEINNKSLDTDLLPNGITDVDQQPADSNDNSPSAPPPAKGDDSVSQPVDTPSVGENPAPAPAPAPSPSGENASNPPPAGDSAGGNQPSGDGEDDSKVDFQVEDPNKELQNDVAGARAACDEDAINPSNNWQDGELSADGLSLTHIRGNKIISAKDFNGAVEVNEISDAYGFIIICDLHIASMHTTGGRIVLVNSLVDSWERHVGDIGVAESRAIVGNSKGKVEKQNAEAPNLNGQKREGGGKPPKK